MPYNQKVSSEMKVELARKCVEGELGVKEASRIAGVDSASMRKWIVRYESEGIDDFLLHDKNRVYGAETK